MKYSGFIVTLLILMTLYGCRNEPANTSSDSASDKHRNMVAQELIMTIGASPVYEPEFRYWLEFMEQYYKTTHGYDNITNWDATQNGLPLREYLLTSATDYLCKDRAVARKVSALNIELSAAQRETLQAERTRNIRLYGSESEYRRIITSMYQSEAVFDYLMRMKHLGNNLFAHLYGARGEKCSAQCVAAYVEHENFMAAQYIFLASNDHAGKPLPAAQRKQNAQRLQDFLQQLDASADPPALFAQLMHTYSDDQSLADFPDGRLIATGSKDFAFGQAYARLADYQYSRIVTAREGDYLILRLPITPDMVADIEGNTLRYWAAYQYHFRNQICDWCAQLPIQYENSYYDLYN